MYIDLRQIQNWHPNLYSLLIYHKPQPVHSHACEKVHPLSWGEDSHKKMLAGLA